MELNLKAFFVALLSSLLFVIPQLDGLFKISGFSFVLSIFFGISSAVTQIMQTKALGNGPTSTVTLIFSCGFLIPIFYGLAFWDEAVSLPQWAGVILLVVSLTLSIGKSEQRGKRLVWIPFAVIAMLCSGASAVLQKTHQYSEFSKEISFFLVYCLFFSTVFTGLAFLLTKGETKKEAKNLNKKRAFLEKMLLPVCLGAFAASLSFLNLTLAGKISSVIQFPTYNVGSMLLISILSAIIYKDKTTRRQNIGFLIGIVAILVIGLF